MIINNREFELLNLKNKTVGITSGCFDLLHFYHLRYLERCKSLCDILIVGVDSDLLVHQNKNKYPTIPEHHRIAMVDALKCVDITFRMDSLSDLLDKYKYADKLFKNDTIIYGNDISKEQVEKPELIIVPDIEETDSTTKIINKIQHTK